jgi:hypothetical protein
MHRAQQHELHLHSRRGINKLTGDLTLGFGAANPGTATTPMTCQNSGASNSGFGFTSVIPQQVTLAATYGASVSGNFGGTDYEITLA